MVIVVQLLISLQETLVKVFNLGRAGGGGGGDGHLLVLCS